MSSSHFAFFGLNDNRATCSRQNLIVRFPTSTNTAALCKKVVCFTKDHWFADPRRRASKTAHVFRMFPFSTPPRTASSSTRWRHFERGRRLLSGDGRPAVSVVLVLGAKFLVKFGAAPTGGVLAIRTHGVHPGPAADSLARIGQKASGLLA